MAIGKSGVLAGLLVIAAAMAAPAQAGDVATYADARKIAAENGLPILVDFGTEW